MIISMKKQQMLQTTNQCFIIPLKKPMTFRMLNNQNVSLLIQLIISSSRPGTEAIEGRGFGQLQSLTKPE